MSPVLLTDSVTTDLPRAVNYALLWGMDGVVLRTVGGAGDRVPFINEGATRRRLEESELTLAAVDPGMFEGAAANPMSWLNEIDTLDDIAAFCGRMGCDTVRAGALALESDAYDADASASALRKLGARAEALGLRLAVRNEAGTHVATGAGLADLLHRVDLPNVGADWHPADAVIAGEEAAVGLAALLSTGVHVCMAGVRDGSVGANGEWAESAPGSGSVNWAGQLVSLHKMSFDGPLVLDVRQRPVGAAGLAASTALITLIRQALRSR